MTRARTATSHPACKVIAKKCIGCGTCVSVCAYGAVALLATRRGPKAKVDGDLCRGDGLCSSLCATGAIVLRDFSREELFRQIDAAFAGS